MEKYYTIFSRRNGGGTKEKTNQKPEEKTLQGFALIVGVACLVGRRNPNGPSPNKYNLLLSVSDAEGMTVIRRDETKKKE